MSRRAQAGLSLPELMVTMIISLVLLLGIGQIFMSGKQSFNTQTGMGALQENGRFAMFFLQRDLRRAGFPRSFGPGGSLPVLADNTPLTPFVAANTLDGAAGASDQIEIQYNSDPDMNPTVAGVDPDNNGDGVADNESSLDCLGQQVLHGTSYPAPAAVARLTAGTTAADRVILVRNRYYVADLDGDGIPSLYCQGGAANTAPQPVVNGVENFQVLFGEDTDADAYANVYRAAGAVANWNNVVAVRIGLLINTSGPVAEDDDTTQYAVLDAPPITPVNNPATIANELRYRRRVFTATIEIRNKTL